MVTPFELLGYSAFAPRHRADLSGAFPLLITWSVITSLQITLFFFSRL
jgi:hypothetical protein